jgi:hypothetical protein
MGEARMTPEDAIRAEIEQLSTEINRLTAEREGLMRVLRRFEPPPLPRRGMNATERQKVKAAKEGMAEVVLRVVTDASRLKLPDVVTAVLNLRPGWQPNSVKTAVYSLTHKGLLRREGHWYLPVFPVNGTVT